MLCSSFLFFFIMIRPPPRFSLFPYTTLSRSNAGSIAAQLIADEGATVVAVSDSTAGIRNMNGLDIGRVRSEEQTSELQSRQYLVCRLLLEKKIELENTNVTDTIK